MESGRNSAKTRKTNLKIISVLFFLVALVLYGNSIPNEYAFDDEMVTSPYNKETNSKVSGGFAGIKEIFTKRYSTYGGQNYGYRPLVHLTFALEYQLFDYNPHVSHFVNVLLYALTGLLLYLLLRLWLPKHGELFHFLVVLIFLVHPSHTEVVNNLKSRDELLCFLGAIAMLIQFTKYGNTGKLKYMGLGVMYFVLALLSKLTVLAFIGVVPFMLYFFTPLNWRRIALSFGVLAVATVTMNFIKLALLDWEGGVRVFSHYENPLFVQGGLWAKFTAALYTAMFYFKMLVFPYQFSFYYGFDQIRISGWDNITPWLSLLILLALTVYAVSRLKQKDLISFCVIYYIGIMLSFSNLIFPVVGIVGDRFVYMASFGFCLALVHLAYRFFKLPFEQGLKGAYRFMSRHSVFTWLLVVVLLLSTVRVVSRNSQWKDRLTLFEADLPHTDRSAKVHLIMANTLCGIVADEKSTMAMNRREQLLKRAIGHYQQAITIAPDFSLAYNSLAFTYVTFYQDPEQAKYWFKKAIEIDSMNIMTLYNLAMIEHANEEYEAAKQHYEQALLVDAKTFDIYNRLSSLYLTLGDTAEAIALNKKGLLVLPKNKQLTFNIATLYHLQKDTLNALPYFREAIHLDPTDQRLQAFYNRLLSTLSEGKRNAMRELPQ
jgi:tetratricopeptide (TPR) repeat protein